MTYRERCLNNFEDFLLYKIKRTLEHINDPYEDPERLSTIVDTYRELLSSVCKKQVTVKDGELVLTDDRTWEKINYKEVKV